MRIKIHTLQKDEQEEAIRLSLVTFMECGKEDYDENGLEVFQSFIYDEEKVSELTFLGAFDGDKLIGTLAFKKRDGHLSLFFVHSDYHRMGVGRNLFNTFLSQYKFNEITVNSSTYAVPFYESLGFKKLAEKQNYHGLISVPLIFHADNTTTL